ncbi:LysR substrate-binding domain-containing protein [Herbaspirillum sp. RTI4]|uniref:LysR substrate-binding domain-containing protein n=1 Tax=Herbaspirillum sp. RTI4 TaxID=3048640 RepID=UPI002AB3A76C|nr:LysR substrate-binding domain-containing protein [Herbaspirillum sp. RTI4]MDY7578852.1 LysR substrate-binding domain-containing protein [Herbaspirillum sp. RTI4]MEA9982995.1 LysR substrate-binding domain-containing protein [Herbaspirillum sp. RTI4]
MELRQLRYFVAIVDHGSLSRAARVLHIAQPALTQQVRQLEEELAAQLLHRSAQGVIATDAGKIFYEHAQAILKQVTDARSAVSQTTDKPSGTVALGIPQSVSGALALPMLTAIRASYPDIALQLTEELTGNLIVQLRSGRINLAILFDDGQLGAFSCTPMVEEEMMYITRADSQYGIGRAKSVTLAKALRAPLILPGLQHGVRPRIEDVVRGAGMALENVIEINSVTIMKSAILADLGATILPVAPLLSEIERGNMIATPISDARLTRTLVLCASKNIPLTTAAAAVSRLVLEVTDSLTQTGAWAHTQTLARAV